MPGEVSAEFEPRWLAVRSDGVTYVADQSVVRKQGPPLQRDSIVHRSLKPITGIAWSESAGLLLATRGSNTIKPLGSKNVIRLPSRLVASDDRVELTSDGKFAIVVGERGSTIAEISSDRTTKIVYSTTKVFVSSSVEEMSSEAVWWFISSLRPSGSYVKQRNSMVSKFNGRFSVAKVDCKSDEVLVAVSPDGQGGGVWLVRSSATSESLIWFTARGQRRTLSSWKMNNSYRLATFRTPYGDRLFAVCSWSGVRFYRFSNGQVALTAKLVDSNESYEKWAGCIAWPKTGVFHLASMRGLLKIQLNDNGALVSHSWYAIR